MSVKYFEILQLINSNRIMVGDVRQTNHGFEIKLVKGRKSVRWAISWAQLMALVVAHGTRLDQDKFEAMISDLVKPLKPE